MLKRGTVSMDDVLRGRTLLSALAQLLNAATEYLMKVRILRPPRWSIVSPSRGFARVADSGLKILLAFAYVLRGPFVYATMCSSATCTSNSKMQLPVGDDWRSGATCISAGRRTR